MKLSQESRHGLVALTYLATQPAGSILQVGQVAAAAGLPAGFLAKIFLKLTQHGLLRSFRGRERGYCLARPAPEITVRQVVEAIEGPDLFQRCLFWNEVCSETSPCLLHKLWGTVRPQVEQGMAHLSLAELAARWEPPVPGRPR